MENTQTPDLRDDYEFLYAAAEAFASLAEEADTEKFKKVSDDERARCVR